MQGLCRLCNKDGLLRESHIIPSFIFKWQKRTSGAGFLRFGKNINKRAQDGLKLYWLCEDCEKLFNAWETYFSKYIFYPLAKEEVKTLRYNNNFIKFCTSITWRILKYYIEMKYTANFPEKFKKEMDICLKTWQEFMLGKQMNPVKYELHFIDFTGSLEGDKNNVSKYINRYLHRVIDIDVIFGVEVALVYAKIPNFLIIGYPSDEEQSCY